MILAFPNGQPIRGDLIVSAVLRNDLAPIPLTLEAEIRAGDEGMEKRLAEGEIITARGDALRIVKSVRVTSRSVQGPRGQEAFRITALLDACLGVAYTRRTAILKENAALSVIYRAAGAILPGIEADFPVPRFYCPVGDTPSFHIARALQEEGGAVRWKEGKLRFLRLPDLFRQKPALGLPDNVSEAVESGFLERHSVPWFFSLAPDATAVFGNREKPRAARFSPFKDVQRLRNMTRCLVQRKISRIALAGQIAAGDLIAYANGDRLAVITAAHVFESGTDGGGTNTYTRLWVGSLEE